MCFNGTFGFVCDEGWSDSDAAVVCGYMGYSSPYYSELILNSITARNFNITYISTISGSEATGGRVFGLSDETPVLQNMMCSGSEYTLSDCAGYDLNNVTGDYCLSGNYQAGVRCIEGTCL